MTVRRSRRHTSRRGARRSVFFLALGSGAAFLGASWFAARRLADRLISARGLGPAPEGRAELIRRLQTAGANVADYRHPGGATSPVELAAIFASRPDAASAPTILFLHGKGGASAEWEPEALRALDSGYNVLIPDLRGHAPSRGDFVTYGFLEKHDLVNAIGAAKERFGLDAARLGIHSCSAGSTIALELAAARSEIRAIWLESPYADARQMAQHYLSRSTGLPRWLLRATTRWAIRRAIRRVQLDLNLPRGESGFGRVDPLASAARAEARVCVVYGARDRLVPPAFVERLIAALPPDTIVWHPRAAGHCHHDDEAARVVTSEYDRRWREFFGKHLPLRETDLAIS